MLATGHFYTQGLWLSTKLNALPLFSVPLLPNTQLLQATNRLGEAEPLMRRALAIDEKSYGTEHPNVARDLNNLAGLLQNTNRLDEAEPLMRRSLAILLKFTHETGDLHPNLRNAFYNYFALLKKISLDDEEIAECLDQAGLDAGLDLQNFSKLLEQL